MTDVGLADRTEDGIGDGVAEHVRIRVAIETTVVRNFNAAEFDEMVALVQRGLPVEQAVTHRFPLSEAEAAFELFRSGDCGKILFVSEVGP